MARGAVVVIVSDGWERDDPALLGEQMARLARLGPPRRVGQPAEREPRATSRSSAGMAAALPYVDCMVSGHSLAAMDELLEAIRTS